MKEKIHTFKYKEYERGELPEDLQALVNTAISFAQQAYAPYSCFRVGAALELTTGEIVPGANQENAAYPSGLCAERVAAFGAAIQFPNTPFSRIAIVALPPDAPSSKPISPCGACRQVLLEYEQKFNHNIEVILASQTGKTCVFPNIKSLLPFSFDAAALSI
ncbi:MAG: cytidine deaminase [Bacteroidales bacterium]|jgi:cytidine deaminase|nr:cytidine deaminase [Bacteroidales bacterium]